MEPAPSGRSTMWMPAHAWLALVALSWRPGGHQELVLSSTMLTRETCLNMLKPAVAGSLLRTHHCFPGSRKSCWAGR